VNRAVSRLTDRQLGSTLFEELVRDSLRGLAADPQIQGEASQRAALERISKALEFDTADLLFFEAGDGVRWYIGSGGRGGDPREAPELAVVGCPWICARMARGGQVRMRTPDDLPVSAATDRDACTRGGIGSLYGIAWQAAGVTTALVLTSGQPGRLLNRQTLDRLRTLGELIGGAAVQSQRQLQLMASVEAASVGLWSLDYPTMTFWATGTARAMHGIGPDEEITLDRVLSVVHPDDRRLVVDAIERAAASAEGVRVEYRVVSGQSAPSWIAARGHSRRTPGVGPARFMGACADITDRRRAEEDLKNAKALTDAVFDSVPGMLYLYTKDGRLTRWNKQHEVLTGYSSAELGNMRVPDWFRPENLPAVYREWGKVFSEGHASVEVPLKRKDGSVIPFLLTGVAVEIGGEPHLVGIGIDITDRLNAEAASTQLRNELMHATRVKTVAELASALAHELNQPLTAALSNAQAVKRWLAGATPELEEARTAAGGIVRSVKRAGEIVHGLRSLMAKGEGIRERLCVDQLVCNVAGLVNAELVLSGVPLKLDLAGDLPKVEAGSTEIQQIILNLVLNAIAAQKDTSPATRQIAIRTSRKAEAVVVSVCDRGHGISSDSASRLFEPFYTTKASGLGMGLAISQRIAEAYGGHLWAENNPDGGATFHLSLPAAEEAP
jgi:two-component system sensor kinase FixL